MVEFDGPVPCGVTLSPLNVTPCGATTSRLPNDFDRMWSSKTPGLLNGIDQESCISVSPGLMAKSTLNWCGLPAGSAERRMGRPPGAVTLSSYLSCAAWG